MTFSLQLLSIPALGYLLIGQERATHTSTCWWEPVHTSISEFEDRRISPTLCRYPSGPSDTFERLVKFNANADMSCSHHSGCKLTKQSAFNCDLNHTINTSDKSTNYEAQCNCEPSLRPPSLPSTTRTVIPLIHGPFYSIIKSSTCITYAFNSKL